MSNVRRRELFNVPIRATVAATRPWVQYTTLDRSREFEAGVRHLEGRGAPTRLAK
jgi:hypothetical protein